MVIIKHHSEIGEWIGFYKAAIFVAGGGGGRRGGEVWE